MKNKIVIYVLTASLLLSGCSVIYPTIIPSLPHGESDLPSVQEVEVSEADETVQDGETLSETEATTLEPFDTSDFETGESSLGEATVDLFLTEDDVNYAYEYAYRTGDYSNLDDNEQQVLSVAVQIVEQCEGLTDYESALYVNDYLTATVTYGFSSEPYSEFGALIEHMAVCQGYAYAYKLCMDLLGIPCITVGGTADNGEEVLSHAWNMIQLDDEWYHVDVTWNDAVTSVDYGSWNHLYFCVDDAFISQNHEWTDLVQTIHGLEEIPKASDTSLFYYGYVKDLYTTQEELEESFDADYMAGVRQGAYCCYGFEPDISFLGNYASGSVIYQVLGDYTLLYVDMQ